MDQSAIHWEVCAQDVQGGENESWDVLHTTMMNNSKDSKKITHSSNQNQFLEKRTTNPEYTNARYEWNTIDVKES